MGARRPRRHTQRAAKAAANNADDKATPTTTSKSGAGPRTEKADTSRNVAKEAVPNLLPTHEEVLEAVHSLYADELKPFGRILRKRVAERAAMSAALTSFGTAPDVLPGCNEKSLPDVDIKHLRATCDASECLVVEPEEGGDWSALISGRPEAFVNVYSPLDVYPAELWAAAALYFEVLSGEEMYLPGGRYSCAQALLSRNLPFLVGRSLGQVCHIVQLAISQKKLLGYLNGAVVPYASSQSMVKEQCAVWQQPCTTGVTQAVGTAPSTLPMATWDTARMCLRDILDTARPGSEPGVVPLSNVKRLFRSRFHVELSETMLGHSKLSELLQDPHFHDICTVQLQGHGYIVVQVEGSDGHTISLADNLPSYSGLSELRADSLPFEPAVCADDEPRRVEFCPDEPLLLEDEGIPLDASVKQATRNEELMPPLARWPNLSPSTICKHGPVGSMVRSTFIHAALPPPTPPAGTRRRSLSLPKDVGSEKSDWEAACHALGFMPRPSLLAHEPFESTVDSSCSKPRSAEERSTRSGSSGTASSPSPSGCELQTLRLDQHQALDDPVKVLLPDCNQFDTGPSYFTGSNDSTEDFTPNGAPLGGETAPARLQFCPGEPLSFEDADIFPDIEARPGSLSPSRPRPLGLGMDLGLGIDALTPISLTPSLTPTHSVGAGGNQRGAVSKLAPVPRWPTLSPAPLVKDGCVGSIALSKVQNTFIHSPLPPPTPLRVDARRRSRSLPKDVGSDKDAWEVTCHALGVMPRPKQQEDKRESAAPDLNYFSGYTPSVPCSLASSPAFVPPSPALTASPTYTGNRTPRMVLMSATGPPSPTNRSNPVLRLADLI